ncbi:MAG: peptidoglycan editing factor PgeF [Oscillospiraceae bacterium]|nr:peptidoglycan editing factor PgeF [Oscillospiraceae bacterium]
MSIITQKNGTLEYLVAEGIAAPHAFTTRLGGVSTGQFASLNIGLHDGEKAENVEKNLQILADELGFDPQKLICTRQTHSDIVRAVTAEDYLGIDHHDYPECDALVTATPGVALKVFTADCTPILLCDPVTGAVGAAHAGWRGTAADIAGKTVRAMVQHFGAKPENIRAAIGPNIGQCCFQTDADVPEAMLKALGEAAEKYIRQENGKYYVNLKAINGEFLRRAGVTHIEISDACTKCENHRFWSHRITGKKRGSQGAIIVCRGVSP